MKQLAFLPTFVFIVLFSCSKTANYKIERAFESLVDDESCKVEYYYPKYFTDNADATELNQILKTFADTEYYTHRCDKTQKEKTIVSGDFDVLLQTGTVLSIEFRTQIITENSRDTVYHSLVMNPEKFEIDGGENFPFLPTPELMFPNFDRDILKAFVEEYNRKYNKSVNVLAYETGSKYAITWGVTKDTFILYVGGEGECFGYDKIEIPRNLLKNKPAL